ncbi:metalloregulator ArsR/SmtB family transcription factor [Roseobacter sp. HKCCD9010]|uniref:ArsR/SmtB family transcription factor n=1 Tax=unclassified Roseobacter TaxID=196798 RepID=UPI0014918838|nr:MULTISPECIES: metalloregulator ArsR/SmtB family transcription factor [unclassified Roseobacter]MBF9048724.1 metalloregulator ArsR/SmtB family transcription factor [Rhodobacterales bacterium HKCCD4356]NNV10723.1 metalloregulator ArsR/SmtB family transcription factor [Roseobacter sp. HKCCD7357]NNV14908.1 metalloregulator ArsR/SmtB family transcription factor [Roseobacter sp. HKCCD8768]NNV24367.1 metalloregulator ArsR/SmtB family transcription factor [Roseobacter sp. HKCCD8192]NNV28624.1 metal
MNGTNNPLAARFAALGDPTRLAIMNRLIEVGPQSAGDLGALADISAPAMSRHLKVLHSAELVHREIDKQRRIYSANPEALQTIATWSIGRREFWTASLDRLTHHLSPPDED